MLIATRLRRILLSTFIPVLLIVSKIIVDKPNVRDEDFFIIIFVIFAGTYLFLELLFLALSEKHEGWKRISLVLGVIGGIAGGFIAFHTDDDFTLIGSYTGLIIGLSIIVIGRWIMRGFKNEE